MPEFTAQQWWSFASNLPLSDSTADKAALWKLFKSMDTSGNAQLSYADITPGLIRALGLNDLGEIQLEIKGAFDYAKDVCLGRIGVDASLDWTEFSHFVTDLKHFFFDRFVESTRADGDGKMNRKEFGLFVKKLGVWGVDMKAEVEYDSLDRLQKPEQRHSGTILWPAIATWLTTLEKDFDRVQVGGYTHRDSNWGMNGLYDLNLMLGSDGTTFDIEAEKLRARRNQSTADIDAPALIKRLPCSICGPDVQKRSMMWNAFDTNGNGGLTLGEVEGGLTRLLKTAGEKLVDIVAPAISRAFHAARDADGRSEATYVTRGEEFRLLLVYLKHYIELLVAFDRIDTSSDRMIDRVEFERAIPLLASWGVAFESDPGAEFRKLLADSGDKIMFDGFAGWAIGMNLDLDTSDNVASESGLAKQHKSSSTVVSVLERGETERRVLAMDANRNRPRLGGGDLTQGWDLPALVAKLPISETKKDKEHRLQLFAAADSSGNGLLTVSEVQLGLSTLLGKNAVRAFNAAIISAFRASKDADGNTAGSAADRVSREEFHTLLVNLRRYLELLVCFHQVDVSDDSHISLAEFQHALPLIKTWGVHMVDPVREFDAMDAAGGRNGKVLFNEFAGWALRKNLDVWHGQTEIKLQGGRAVPKLPSIGNTELTAKHAMLGQTVSTLPQRRWQPNRTGYVGHLETSLDLTAGMSALIHTLPASKTETDREARAELFSRLDTRGVGVLSCNDVDRGLRALLASAIRPVTHAPLPIIKQAIDNILSLKDESEHCITKRRFRQFLCNLKWYDNHPTAQAGASRRAPKTATAAMPGRRGQVGRLGGPASSKSVGFLPVLGSPGNLLRSPAHSKSSASLHTLGGQWPMWTATDKLSKS